MAERTRQTGNAEQQPAIHAVVVPERLRDQVEEHVRQLAGEEDDTSAYVGMRLLKFPIAVSCIANGGTDFTPDMYSVWE